jgi:hypothetical protein
MVPPPKILTRKKSATGLRPRIMSAKDGRPIVRGMSAANSILNNKNQKSGILPRMQGKATKYETNTMELDPSMRLLQGPPAMVMAGFEGGYSMNQKNLELARSKFLLDKLTGKLPEHLR